MRLLQLLFRASPATLLLVLCLQLGANKAQDNTRKIIIKDFDIPKSVRPNEEVTATLAVQTELKECMVVKTYLISSVPLEGGFNYKYTACLCNENPKTFYWDFYTNRTVRIAAVVDVIRELGICPDDAAVIPIKNNRFYTIETLEVE
ncbi:prolactin-inducible protein homolog [Symphalangus syndactylus]|uniref:Prolactin-inducible protein homolog n=2 Tax=Symphalangus syndactylus TaxID=9590 RepID=PIP_SYMSY|nr:prolactin-inducible protein [Symphalangus syndactylus]A0A889.1 RecName: Full=Prolactin-inducible protein homolog; AltName: Full=Prolactin-induced protein; Flags: Precursor [Symphalangus syndactylus]BAF35625.1 prolactin-induced protein [Symphalangus syndactylus]